MEEIMNATTEDIKEEALEAAKAMSFIDFLKACAKVGIPVLVAMILYKKVLKPGFAAMKAKKEMSQTDEANCGETVAEIVDSEE